ncbi:RNA polymerase sigma factor [Mycobacterium yunnanensis]|uniref:RNA polymerase sigma factor n=1 Tax=Mycobacterium yunnanensis TaxID=368477 RepID=A0A9X2Z7P4_9MYCO|nr:RNA polymerase sigma factor [Mycobacterium yunnanensis]MCV7423017.1 RNA polymerase sigma factor [Mycobacterium yunnanensis]
MTAENARRTAAPVRLTGSFDDDVAALRPELHRYATRLTRHSSDAEDLVQETMLRAFKAYGRLRQDTFVTAWLFTIARNTWFSMCRASSRRPEVLSADVGDYASATPHAVAGASAEVEALGNDIDPDLAAALAGLSEEMRATVFHVAVGDMLSRDAADLLGVSTNTVLTRMHRSRRALRRALNAAA